MTTPNDQESTDCISVDGAPGGRFYVKQEPETLCAHCGAGYRKDDNTFSCKTCFIQMCAACVAFGYDQVHDEVCQSELASSGGSVNKKGIVDKYIKYLCVCGSEPEPKSCGDCLVNKIKKYNCFNCDEPRQATVICGNCLNHFVCSAECHAKDMSKTHNHAKTCGKSLPVWCRHGRAVLLHEVQKCDCIMCEHGMWSEDCYICIAANHVPSATGSKRPRRK